MTAPLAAREPASAGAVPTRVLAFNDPYHDSSFCLLEAGSIRHVEVERWTRVKYEAVNPVPVFCELFPDEIERWFHVAIEEGDHLSPLIRRLRQEGRPFLERPDLGGALLAASAPPVAARHRAPGPPLAFAERPVRAFLEHLLRPEVTVHFCGHHAAHVANAFHSSGLDAALVVSLDGGGYDFGIERGGDSVRREIYGAVYDCSAAASRPLEQITDVSLGLAWSRTVTELFGMGWGEEGTVMAMAALGDPRRFRDEMERPEPWLPNRHLLDRATREALDGALRRLRSALTSEQSQFDFAAALQAATESRARRLLERFVTERHRNLCLTGGLFLNCQLAGKVGRWLPWLETVYLPPAPYDGGVSIGAAQLVHHERLAQPNWLGPQRPAHFALGRGYSRLAVMSAIRSRGLAAREASGAEVVVQLEAGRVVALFAGSSESGRRALGQRSILADPRRAELKEKLNREIKHRRWFRPFAPMVLAEHVGEWFECDERFASPYMSFAVPVRAEVRDRIPAVLHADGTARVQTVHRELSPATHELLAAWHRRSGVPVLLNTSFNDHEPIVETPEHALETFRRTGIDLLYFADHGLLVARDDAAVAADGGATESGRGSRELARQLRSRNLELDRTRRERDDLRRQLAELQESRSWRLTAPLRRLHDRLRRPRRGGRTAGDAGAAAPPAGEEPWLQVTYAGLVVEYRRDLDGGGSWFGQEFVPFLRNLGMPRRRRVFEWCAGPGFIGFSMLANGLCDSLCLADVNPRAVEACRRTIERNRLADRVAVHLADNLRGLPADERWDLVVGNPPHFADRHAGELKSHDASWSLHREFFGQVGRFLAPGGLIVLQENNRGSTAATFRPMIDDAGLRIVFEHGGAGSRTTGDRFYFLGIGRADEPAPDWADLGAADG